MARVLLVTLMPLSALHTMKVELYLVSRASGIREPKLARRLHTPRDFSRHQPRSA